jgi:hypothetical protein
MSRVLYALAALLLVVTVATWWATGAHFGWSKNRIETRTVDEITGIEQITWQDQFIAGVDTLLLGGLVAGALGAAGWWAGRTRRRAQ